MPMKLRNEYIKAALIILFWITLFAASWQYRSEMVGGVVSYSALLEDDTESGIGTDLYLERFNISGEDTNHIIVLELPGGEGFDDITNTQWRAFTFYLSYYLNETTHPLGYTDVFSEPVLLDLYGSTGEEAASKMISETKLVGLIYIVWPEFSEDDLDVLADDTHIIRDMLANMPAFYDWAFEADASYSNLPDYAALPTMEDSEQVNLILTGEIANYLDVVEVGEQTLKDSEVIAIVVILVILALVFRSPLGVAIPLIAMAASLFPTYMITFFMSEAGWLSINDFLPSIIAMIGIAVAVDYNLFSLVRYREEYRKRKAEHEKNGTWTKENKGITKVVSARIMNRTAGSAVMYSGITVIIGFMALIFLGSDFTLGVAIGVSVGVVLSIITARTLTPAILALIGNILDWPNFISGASKEVEANKNGGKKSKWVGWSRLVMKRSWTFLIIGILFMAPFVIFSMDTEVSFDLVKNMPAGTESREGFELIEENFNLGALYPIDVIVDAHNNNGIFSTEIIDATNALGEWVLNYEHERHNGDIVTFKTFDTLSAVTLDNGTLSTMSLEDINDLLSQSDYYIIPDVGVIPNMEKLSFVHGQLPTYVNIDNGNNTLKITITANYGSGSPESWELINALREEIGDLFADTGADAYVTGISASFLDTSDSLYADVPMMLLLAVGLIFVALMVLFRSILLPIKAILTISGSILFGLGSLVMIFQYGYFQLIELFGITLWEAEVTGISFIIPVFLFTIILGLGMDYSIIIISRIREEYEKNGDDIAGSVGVGLSKTAGAVTSAAAIMIATFMVFAASPMLIMKMIGLAMAVAVFVDASIARIILLPSAMRIAGKWNFWLPKWLDKILPKIKLDH